MNPVINAIQSRHSCRNFSTKAIAHETLAAIAEAGKYAPTAHNAKTRILTVVTDAAHIKQIYTAVGAANGRQDYTMYNPKALILCSEDRADDNGLANCACSMQNMMLAATSLGIGSVWINQSKTVCDEPGVRAVLNEFSLPAAHIVWAIIALGHPAAQLEEKSKEDMTVQWF